MKPVNDEASCPCTRCRAMDNIHALQHESALKILAILENAGADPNTSAIAIVASFITTGVQYARRLHEKCPLPELALETIHKAVDEIWKNTSLLPEDAPQPTSTRVDVH